MASLYVFRHIPSGILVTIPNEWSEVGNRKMVIDEVEDYATAPAKRKKQGAFTIMGCITKDPEDGYPDKRWAYDVHGENFSKLPDDWEYDVYEPSIENQMARIEGLRPIPEKEADRNDFARKGLL